MVAISDLWHLSPVPCSLLIVEALIRFISHIALLFSSVCMDLVHGQDFRLGASEHYVLPPHLNKVFSSGCVLF